MKFAQILYGKAHWIFEADTMPEFAPDIVIVDITNLPVQPQEGWNYVDGGFVEPVGPSLEELKSTKRDSIRRTRDTLEQSGFTYLDKIIDSDALSVQRIAIAVQAAQAAISAGQTLTLDWTCQDNSTLTMTAQDICGMPVALATYSNSLHETARNLRTQIEIATTAEELELIVWPT